MTHRCLKIVVSGTVQGVGFRYFTYREALKLGVTGYVLNLNDGRVEIVACGDEAQLSALMDWLKKGGPTTARVKDIVTTPSSEAYFDGFSVR